MKDLLEHIARSLVDHPDEVQVEQTNQGSDLILTLHVAADDMGRVIGKGGKVANALRALLRMAAARSGQYVQLEIE